MHIPALTTDSGRATGRTARRALAAIRIVNGAVALVAPGLILKQFAPKVPPDDPAATYGLRLFGVRTVVIGADLLTLRDDDLERSLRQAVVIHASDTLTSLALAKAGRLPRRASVVLPLISAVNTGLAVAAWRSARAGARR
jgi:hypothetical protein